MKTSLALAALVALAVAPAFAQQGQMGAHFLEQWDADADGRVTPDEARTKRADVFYMFDTDTDGTLNAEEWAGVAEHLAAEMGPGGNGQGHGMGNGPGQHIHAAMTPEFNDIDANGAITADEFTAATDKLFPLIDTDADGAVTVADFGRP
jgi:Ca2+-binding EF-hand superfamily protein